MRVVAALGEDALLRRGQPLTAENQRWISEIEEPQLSLKRLVPARVLRTSLRRSPG